MEIPFHVFAIIVDKLDKNPALGFLIVSMMFNAFQYREKNILTEKIFGLLSRFKIKNSPQPKEIHADDTKIPQLNQPRSSQINESEDKS